MGSRRRAQRAADRARLPLRSRRPGRSGSRHLTLPRQSDDSADTWPARADGPATLCLLMDDQRCSDRPHTEHGVALAADAEALRSAGCRSASTSRAQAPGAGWPNFDQCRPKPVRYADRVGAVPFPIPFSGTLETVPRLTAHAHRDSLCASDRDPVPASRRRINTAFPHVRSWKVRKRTLPHSTVSASSPTNVPTGWAVLLALLAGWGITLRLGLLLVIPLAAVIVIVVLVVIYPGSLVATAVLTGGAGGGYHGIKWLIGRHRRR